MHSKNYIISFKSEMEHFLIVLDNTLMSVTIITMELQSISMTIGPVNAGRHVKKTKKNLTQQILNRIFYSFVLKVFSIKLSEVKL